MFCDGLYGTLLFLDIAYSSKKKKLNSPTDVSGFRCRPKTPKRQMQSTAQTTRVYFTVTSGAILTTTTNQRGQIKNQSWTCNLKWICAQYEVFIHAFNQVAQALIWPHLTSVFNSDTNVTEDCSQFASGSLIQFFFFFLSFKKNYMS